MNGRNEDIDGLKEVIRIRGEVIDKLVRDLVGKEDEIAVLKRTIKELDIRIGWKRGLW